MFKKMEVLENSKHQDLRFSKAADFSFAKKISSVQLTMSEMGRASMFYPIVFPVEGECLPLAILSFGKEMNNYVDEIGQWKAPYIPSWFRFYPFALAKVSEDQETNQTQFALCIDAEAEHFQSEFGDPLFTANGEAGDFVKNIVAALERNQKDMVMTQGLFKEIDETGIIVEKELSFDVEDGDARTIKGFRVIDMAKLQELDDATLVKWAKNGTLAFVYDHVRSVSNLNLLAGKPVSLK